LKRDPQWKRDPQSKIYWQHPFVATTSYLMLPTFHVLLVSFPTKKRPIKNKKRHWQPWNRDPQKRDVGKEDLAFDVANIPCFVGLFSKRDPQKAKGVGNVGKETDKTQHPLFCGSLFQKRPTKYAGCW